MANVISFINVMSPRLSVSYVHGHNSHEIPREQTCRKCSINAQALYGHDFIILTLNKSLSLVLPVQQKNALIILQFKS